MGAGFGANMSSVAPAAMSFTSRSRGVVIVVSAWMLDPVACAGMAVGAPRVTLAALAELHQLLTERGFRRSSLDDPTVVQEEQHEEFATGRCYPQPLGSSASGSIRQGLRGMTPPSARSRSPG
jgi:hypothetical protein